MALIFSVIRSKLIFEALRRSKHRLTLRVIYLLSQPLQVDLLQLLVASTTALRLLSTHRLSFLILILIQLLFLRYLNAFLLVELGPSSYLLLELGPFFFKLPEALGPLVEDLLLERSLVPLFLLFMDGLNLVEFLGVYSVENLVG